MNVNQSAPPVPPYGQPQPVYAGYHQSSYGGQPGSTAPPTPYEAYNGPIPGYQQTPPPGMFPSFLWAKEGNQWLDCISLSILSRQLGCLGLENMNLDLGHWELCGQSALLCFYVRWLYFCLKTSSSSTFSMFSGSLFPVGITLCSLLWMHCSKMDGRVLVTGHPEPLTRIEYFLLTESLLEITCSSCILIVPLIILMVLSIDDSGT